jgi:hypothetical protein
MSYNNTMMRSKNFLSLKVKEGGFAQAVVVIAIIKFIWISMAF